MAGAEDHTSHSSPLLDTRGAPSAPALVWHRDCHGVSAARRELTLQLALRVLLGEYDADAARAHEAQGLQILGVL